MRIYEEWSSVGSASADGVSNASAEADPTFEWEKRGLLFVYKDKEKLDAYEGSDRLLGEKFGHAAKKLDGDELVAMEPAWWRAWRGRGFMRGMRICGRIGLWGR